MYQVHSCILGTQDEHKTIFYGTRALVHRSKVGQPLRYHWLCGSLRPLPSYMCVCLRFPPLCSKEREKNARSQVSFVGTSNGNLRCTNALLLCICHDTAIVTRKSVMR